MKKSKKIIYAIIIFLALVVIKEQSVNAASASISTNGTGTVNTPISVSVSGTAAQWNLKLIVDGKVVATSSELDSVENKAISFSGSYTPTSAGAKNVSIEGTITDADGTTTRSFSSKTITVAEKTPEPAVTANNEENKPAETKKESTPTPAATNNNTSSSSASLSNLGIYTYDFKGFKPDTTTYNTTVPNNVTSVQVYAVPKDGAVYHVTGNTNLDVGTNKVTITVTSADKKTTKNYYIYVARKEADGEEKTKEDEIIPNVVEEKKEEKEKLGLISIAIDEKSELSLEPEFKPEIFEYAINFKGDLDKIPLNAIANKEGAKVEITGNEKLKDGENTILITVTSGEEKAEYKIKVKKNIDKVQKEEKSEEIEKKESTTIKAEPAKENSQPKVWYIVGGVGGLSLLVLIIIFIKHKKGKKEDEFDFGSADDNAEDNNDKKINRFDFKKIEIEKEETSKYEEKHSKGRSKKGKHF